MSASSPAIEHYLREYREAADQLPGGDLPWVQRARKGAIDCFAEIGFPTRRDEDWKYTNVGAIEKHAFRPSGRQCMGLAPEDLQPYLIADLPCHLLVFVNGRYIRQPAQGLVLPQGVQAASLEQTLVDNPAAVEPYLGGYVDAGKQGFTALNTALMGDGAYVHIARNVVLPEPIHLLYLSTAQDGATACLPRNLIVAEQNSQATVIESYVSVGDAGYFTNVVTEAVLAQNAHVSHYKLQHESSRAYHVATLQAQQDKDSHFRSDSLSFGGNLARNDINSVLDGEGAECILNGLYMVGGRQHVDFHTRVDHRRPHCTSREFFKGVLDGRSRGVFNGRVYVHPDAQKTDAQQTNNNLLLSKNAEVDTKPQLEIFADDVKCSHGATVGQLDPNMTFYLRSRGIEEQAARAILTYAFARDIVDRIKLAPLRAGLEQTIAARLPNAGRLRDIL